VSESGIIDAFVMYGPKPSSVAQEYARLTGTTYLPPKWSIAYHQCRWNYISTEDVKEVDANFDVHNLPYDTIWLDIEHTNDKRCAIASSNFWLRAFAALKKCQQQCPL
jgi:alpha 1,3-glucosidase